MAQIGVDPATGMLTLDGQVLDRNDPRLWGSRGLQQDRHEVADPGQAGNDSGSGMMWVDPTEYWAALQATGRHQLGSAGVSSGQEGQGFGEFNINHLDDLQWDPEFGITTSNPAFIDSADDPDDRARMRRWRTAILTAATGGLAAEAGLLGSAGAGGVNAATGYGLGGAAGEAAAVGGMGGMGGVAGSTLIPTAGMLSESLVPAGMTAADLMGPVTVNGLTSSVPWWQTALNYAANNPISAARGIVGVASAIGSMGSSGSSGGGGSSGYQWPSGPVPTFDPVGNAGQFQSNQSQYQPMQFDPVPFMGGSMYYNQQQPNFMGSWGGFNQNAMNFGGGYTPAQYLGGGGPAQGYQMSGYGMGQSGQPFMSSPFGMGQQQPQQPKPYMPPQFNMNQQQPQQGGLLGNVQTMAGGQPDGFGPNNPGQNPHYGRYANNGAFVADPSAGASQMDQSPLVPGMTNREVMGYARYLPGNKSPLDPLVSQNLLQKSGGNWQSMVPQRAQAGFQQFMNAFGNPQSFGDYQNFLKAR